MHLIPILRRMVPAGILLILVTVLSRVASGRLLPGPPPVDAALPLWLGYLFSTLQLLCVGRLVDRAVHGVLHAHREGPSRVSGIGEQIIRFIIYFAVAAAAISIVYEQSISAILAASGIVGLIVGFGLRGLVADVFSGIAINIDPNIRPGDWLDVQLRGRSLHGRVVEVQWRCTILADRLNNHVAVPNSELGAAVVTNRSRPSPLTEYSVTVPVGTEYPVATVKAALEAALGKVAGQGLILDRDSAVRFTAIENDMMAYRLMFMLDIANMAPVRAQSAVMQAALENLALAGISATRVERQVAVAAEDPAERRRDEIACRVLALDRVSMLAPLGHDDLVALAQGGVIRRYRAGDAVFRQGEPGDTMIVLLEGSLDILIERDGETRRLTQLWPGDCVGEMSLLTGQPRTATVIAEREARAIEIGRAAFRNVLLANAALADDIGRLVEMRALASAAPLALEQGMAVAEQTRGTLASVIRRLFGLED